MKRAWLQAVEGTLFQEGFRTTWLQVAKSGQVFGLVKKLGEIWEMHVRGFEDGGLEAEIEISRKYVQHLASEYRRDAIRELKNILDAYNIPYKMEGTLPEAMGALRGPRRLTPWKPLVAIAGIVILLRLFGNRTSVAIRNLFNREPTRPATSYSVISLPHQVTAS